MINLLFIVALHFIYDNQLFMPLHNPPFTSRVANFSAKSRGRPAIIASSSAYADKLVQRNNSHGNLIMLARAKIAG